MEQQQTYFEKKIREWFNPAIASVIVFLSEVIQIVVISSAIILPIRYFLIQPFYVKGASMEPTFFDKEYLIINELHYRLNEPVRGDVAVFRYPRIPSEYFIKRVIGLPGETVEIRDGKIFLYTKEKPNGYELQESYLDEIFTDGIKRVTLGLDEFYVLGDNRDESMDSRMFGPVKREYFIGRVMFRGLPLSRMGVIDY